MTRAAALGLLLLLAGPSWSGTLAVTPSGFLRVEGDSSLHKWISTATVVRLTSGGTANQEVRIPVSGLRSGEAGMDKNTRAAMKAAEFPDIVFRMTKYEAGKLDGELTIAGRTRPVTLDVELEGRRVRGAYALKMSDYGIKPPSLMLGAIKVRDAVTVRFDLQFPGETP